MEQFEVDFENNILPWLGKTAKMVDYFTADYFMSKGHEITKAQVILLLRLNHCNGTAQSNLADLTNRDKASLARLLDTMEKKNLLARIPSKSDGRINEIHITKKGNEVLKTIKPLLDEVMKEVQKGLSKKEISNFIETLKKVNKNIKGEQFIAFQTNKS